MVAGALLSYGFSPAGVALTPSCVSAAISAFAVAALLLPGSYPDYLDMISSLSIGPVLIGMAKLGIAFPVSYHTYNGIRHLVRQRLISALLLVFSGTILACVITHLQVFPEGCTTSTNASCLLSPLLLRPSHQCWDLGKGFRIPEVYRSGYTVITLSILTSVALMFL